MVNIKKMKKRTKIEIIQYYENTNALILSIGIVLLLICVGIIITDNNCEYDTITTGPSVVQEITAVEHIQINIPDQNTSFYCILNGRGDYIRGHIDIFNEDIYREDIKFDDNIKIIKLIQNYYSIPMYNGSSLSYIENLDHCALSMWDLKIEITRGNLTYYKLCEIYNKGESVEPSYLDYGIYKTFKRCIEEVI